MKGGDFCRWWGNQEWVFTFDRAHYEILSECGNKLPSRQYYFKPGVTWNSMSSLGLSVRLMPKGFIFSDKSDSAFVDQPMHLLGLMNSSPFSYFVNLISPTIDFHSGYVAKVPVPKEPSSQLLGLVEQAVELAKEKSSRDETTFDFRNPSRQQSDDDAQLGKVETSITNEVSRLYGFQNGDYAAIESELASPTSTENAEVVETDSNANSLVVSGPKTWATSWLSYAIGAVLGRFAIGTPGGLGCGNFPAPVVAQIRKLVDADGIMVSDQGHPQDLVKHTLDCLELMLGREAAHATIRTATGEEGDAEDLLRDLMDKQFWKHHFQLYRKRPVYWPLQSPKKKLTIWVFHEKFNKDTLFRVKDQFVQVKINWLEGRIKELKSRALAGDSRESRAAEKEMSKFQDLLDDVQEFAKRLKSITDRGYTPHIDDGILLNAAPLWELLPSWPETKKAWQELENEHYDWAQQAMEHWPERVKEKCRTNKSFAIAHGLA